MRRMTHIIGMLTICAPFAPANGQRSTLPSTVQWYPLSAATKEFTGTSLTVIKYGAGGVPTFAFVFRAQHAGQSVWAMQGFTLGGRTGITKAGIQYLSPNVGVYTSPSPQYAGYQVVFLHHPMGTLQMAGQTSASAGSDPGVFTQAIPVNQLDAAANAILADPNKPTPTGSQVATAAVAYSIGMQYTLLSDGQYLRLSGNRTLISSGGALVLRTATSVIQSWKSNAWIFLRPDMSAAVLEPIGLSK